MFQRHRNGTARGESRGWIDGHLLERYGQTAPSALATPGRVGQRTTRCEWNRPVAKLAEHGLLIGETAPCVSPG
jgi:hypothetical protein